MKKIHSLPFLKSLKSHLIFFLRCCVLLGTSFLALGCTESQNETGIWPKTFAAKTVGSDTFIYVPPQGIDLPEVTYAYIFYKEEETLQHVRAIIEKRNDSHEFSLDIPKSIKALVIGIVDKTNTVLDNNHGHGFILPSENDSELNENEIVIAETLLMGEVRRKLQLRIQREYLLSLYEHNYSESPSSRSGDSYLTYLQLLYYEDRDRAQPLLLQYAELCEIDSTESSLLQARSCYDILNDMEQVSELDERILSEFPKGSLASDYFMNNFRESTNLSKAEIMERMISYQSQFGQSDDYSTDEFYERLIEEAILQKITYDLAEFEDHLINIDATVEIYTGSATEIMEMSEVSQEDLSFARFLLKRAISLSSTDVAISNPIERHSSLIQKYAQILALTNHIDSACYHMRNLLEQHQLGADGMEKYASYLINAGRDSTAIDFIEQQLLEGLFSLQLLSQLQEMYTRQGRSTEVFDQFESEYMGVTRKRKRQQVLTSFSSPIAPDFSCKNLNGDIVTLSSLRGKIIVLDFWATWCRPCIGMFPDMQKLMIEKKQLKDVEFLFIDSRERDTKDKIINNVRELMNKNGYEFNVLLDFDNKIADAYMVDLLPSKFIIDRNGEIAFMGNKSTKESLSFEIEAARIPY